MKILFFLGAAICLIFVHQIFQEKLTGQKAQTIFVLCFAAAALLTTGFTWKSRDEI